MSPGLSCVTAWLTVFQGLFLGSRLAVVALDGIDEKGGPLVQWPVRRRRQRSQRRVGPIGRVRSGAAPEAQQRCPRSGVLQACSSVP